MSSPFIPSPKQAAILDWLKHGEGSAVVIAVAGSGKTTTLVQGWRHLPQSASVRSFAFNSTIGKELTERLNSLRQEEGLEYRNFAAGTFHSVGFGAVCRYLNKSPRDVRVDGNKLRRIFRDSVGEAEVDMYESFVTKLVSLAKGEGIGALVPDTSERWWALIHHHDLFLDSQETSEDRAVELARELLSWSNESAKLHADIDFDDQLYLVCLWKLRLWQNDYVFVDEAQDTNPVRRAIAKLALKPGGRLIAVGDPRQAIYGFTGASHDAIDLIKKEFNCIELPLTVSFRCAQDVVALAQPLVPYLEACGTAPKGLVHTLALPAALKRLSASDAVLCRNTAPLINLAYELLGRGVGCRVVGRDIGTGLVKLVKSMKARDIQTLEERLDVYETREVAKFTARGEEMKAEAVNDRVACIRTVVNNLPENTRTIAELISRIERMFQDDGAGVLTLSTIHKAKGKEWRVVGILRPDLMPSKWARQDWQKLQEENIQYVCYSRAMEEVIFIDEGK